MGTALGQGGLPLVVSLNGVAVDSIVTSAVRREQHVMT